MPLTPIDYSTPTVRQQSGVSLHVVVRAAITLTIILAVILLVGVGLSHSSLNHRLVVENRSGTATGAFTMDVNGLAMQSSALGDGEIREWYGSEEGLHVAGTGTVKINGLLSDGTPVIGSLPYAFGNGFWNADSRVVIGKGGVVTFEP